MAELQRFIDFLFATKTGLAALIIAGIIISCIVAVCMERRTRKQFPDYSDVDEPSEDASS